MTASKRDRSKAGPYARLAGARIGLGICTFERPSAVERWCAFIVDKLMPAAERDGVALLPVISSADLTPPDPAKLRGIPCVSGWNLGVAWTKNRALRWMLDENCDYLFLIEDDCRIPGWMWLAAYVAASRDVGFDHLMFGPVLAWPHTWKLTGREQQIAGWTFQEYRRLREPQCTPGVISFVTRRALEEAGGLDARFVGRGWGHVEWTERISRVCGHPLPSALWCLRLRSNDACRFPRDERSRGWADHEVQRNERLLAAIRSSRVARPIPDLSYRYGYSSLAAPASNQLAGAELADSTGSCGPDEPLSICVAHKNRWPWLEKLAASVGEWFERDPGDCELVVADFDSDDCDLVRELAKMPFATQVVALDGPFSRSRGLHAAAQAARHRLLVFLDADILVTSAGFGATVRQSVGPRTVFHPVCFNQAEGKLPVAASGNGGWRERGYGLVAILSEDYMAVGGWDRRIGRWGGEDNDLHWHCEAAGFTMVRHRVPELVHQWHPSDRAWKERYTDHDLPSIAGRQWKPPPKRGVEKPQAGHLIALRAGDVEESVDRWGFHRETVLQFREDSGIAAEETAYFSGVKRYRAEGGDLWADCRDDAAIVRRVERFRSLFLDLAERGYDRSRPIKVRIGSGGRIVVLDGHHRAAIVAALDLEATGEVERRATDWIRFQDAAWQLYRDQKLYTPIPHADFHGWRVARDVDRRAAAIGALEEDWAGVTLLDVGACHGGVAFGLADAGADVTAAERNAKFSRVARLHERLLRRGRPRLASWHEGDAWKLLRKGWRWDWVLCLSVLHHEAKRSRAAIGRRLLEALEHAHRGVIVELAAGAESQMRGVDLPERQSDLGQWLHQLSGVAWAPLLEGVPRAQRMSGSDARWLWLARR